MWTGSGTLFIYAMQKVVNYAFYKVSLYQTSIVYYRKSMRAAILPTLKNETVSFLHNDDLVMFIIYPKLLDLWSGFIYYAVCNIVKPRFCGKEA